MQTEYVGQGTFGCAFRPSIPCRQGRSSDTGGGRISKLFFDPAEAEAERRAHRAIMSTLDPRHLFSVRMFHMCRVSSSVPASELARCDGLRGSDIVQIVYEDGGTDLESLLQRVEKERWTAGRRRRLFWQLWEGAGPIFQGIVSLARKNWFHGDIKAENIVWLDGPMRMRLIDFGGAQTWSGPKSHRLRTAGTEIFMAPEWWTFLHRQGDWGNRLKWPGSRASHSSTPAEWEEVCNILLLGDYGDRIAPARQKLVYGMAGDSESADAQLPPLAPAKLDTYCWGLALLQMFGALVLTSRSSDPRETAMEDAILGLLAGMVQRNSADRLDPSAAYRHYRSLRRRQAASLYFPPDSSARTTRGARGPLRSRNLRTGSWLMSDRYTNARSKYRRSTRRQSTTY